MKSNTVLLIVTLILPVSLSAQNWAPFATSSSSHSHWMTNSMAESHAQVLAENDFPGESDGKKNDPAYKLYKDGYNLILEENWEDARKKLAEVIKKYPKSDYDDDAAYWSAYAQMHLDKKKAIKEYKSFIDAYPSSSYYDDAVNDLGNLDSHFYVTSSGDGKVVATSIPGRGYAYAVAPSMRRAERTLAQTLRGINHIHISRGSSTPLALMPRVAGEDEEKLDPETRLRMDALHALGSSKEDSTSFNTLKDVAVDRSQARELRLAAMEELSQFRKHDPLPIFLEIAKNDTSEEIQSSAIDFIGMLPKDKNRSVETLIQLFDAIPSSRSDQRENVFYSIAEVGNDRAVDFLAKVAHTHENYELRSQAIYYLGSIGTEHSRAALYGILKGK